MNKIQNNDLTFSAAIVAALLCVAFGSNSVAVKISLSGMGIFTTIFLRFTIASIAIFIWAKVAKKSLKLRKYQIIHLAILSIATVIQFALIYYGLSKTNASRGTLLINTQPFFVLFLAHLFIPGDSITLKKFLGIIIGFSGVAFIFLQKEGVTSDLRSGDIIMTIAAAYWACTAIYIKRIIHMFRSFHLVFYPITFSLPFFLIGAIFIDKSMFFNINTMVIGSLLFQSLATASFGYIIWNSLLKRYGAVALHSYVFIMPIAGVSLGGLLLGEPITFHIIFSLIFIVTGILFVNFKKPKI